MPATLVFSFVIFFSFLGRLLVLFMGFKRSSHTFFTGLAVSEEEVPFPPTAASREERVLSVQVLVRIVVSSELKCTSATILSSIAPSGCNCVLDSSGTCSPSRGATDASSKHVG